MNAAFAEEEAEELSPDDLLKLVLQRLEKLSADIELVKERQEAALSRQRVMEGAIRDATGTERSDAGSTRSGGGLS